MTALAVPDLTSPREAPTPVSAERTLSTGLRVVAIERSSVPLVELRLRVPFAGERESDVAHASVLGETLLSGTAGLSAVQIAATLQEVGGGLSVSVDPDRLLVSGNALAAGLPRLLEVLAGVLTGAAYPEKEVRIERERLADRIEMAASQPSHAVREALLKRLFGEHPYGTETPEPAHVRLVEPPLLRALHARRVLPEGSVLVLVGDVPAEQVLDAVEAALSPWSATGAEITVPPMPAFAPGPLLLVDRPGSVQSSIRMGVSAVPRSHPDYPALQLANLVFGGYFSSRLVENIREDKGYTYSPHSGIDHAVAGSMIVISADVATEVTAPALVEMAYELGRIATLPPQTDELEQARQYAIGTLALSVASQAGLASMLAALATTGLGLDWLAGHPKRLAAVSADEVFAAAAKYLGPARAVPVVLGDASAVEPSVSALGPVVRG
ncbi:MAG: peptidase [Actinomycetia bacterium]|nr:peptidase [Actinomycetes bacterium]MDQ1657603.1 zinc protease [Cryptosporangiaceae bacterium]